MRLADLGTHFRRLRTEPRTVIWERRAAERLFARYGRLARRAGLDDLRLILSFDCDTLSDAEVAWDVHRRLMDIGVVASYAVPGEILERGGEVYGRIAATGAEFLNHGHSEHTVKRHSVYTSTLFYDQLTPDEVRADVVAGHETVTSVIGRAPRGFRTPHFGTYQRAGQLRHLHGILRDLGYLYSSSTVPLQGFRRGPAFTVSGLLEFPVSGMASAPLMILDSWACFAAPDRQHDANDYGREGRAVLEHYQRAGAGVLSFYADPSQIHDQPVFFDTVAHWVQAARPTTYRELAEELRARRTAG